MAFKRSIEMVEAAGSSVKAAPGTLTTLVRGMAILEFVAHAQQFVRLRDVAEHFDMDRSSALRFLRTLEAGGYLVRHEAMKVYGLGPKIFSLPRAPAGAQRMTVLARPVLEALGRATGQIAHLATLNGLQAVLVEVTTTTSSVSVKQAVGDLEPLYSSAVGKAIFAYTPAEERAVIGRRIDFVSFTANTLKSLQALEAEAAEIHRGGVAFDRQEGNEHVSCMASPILAADGGALAAIGVSYVDAHLDRPIAEMSEHVELVKRSAREIERLIHGTRGAAALEPRSASYPPGLRAVAAG